MQVRIEIAGKKDLSEILNIQKLAFESEAEIYHCHDLSALTQTLEQIEEEFNNKIFFKAVIDDRIAGSVRAYLKDTSCHIERLSVRPDFQNQGIGSKLMQAVEDYFNDVKRFELGTGHKSRRNLYLYKKLGYKVFKEEYYSENITFVYLEKYR